MDDFGIAGNREVFAELVKLLKTGKAIAFVGAGASAPLYPLWTGLIEQLADRAVALRCADSRQRDFWCRKANEHASCVVRPALDSGP